MDDQTVLMEQELRRLKVENDPRKEAREICFDDIPKWPESLNKTKLSPKFECSKHDDDNPASDRPDDKSPRSELPIGSWSEPPSRADNYGSEHFSVILNAEEKHNSMESEAWNALRRSVIKFRGRPIGTLAANDNSENQLNYDQVFVRDFVPSALAFLMHGEAEIVKNFLLNTLRLPLYEKKMGEFQMGASVMPASFKIGSGDNNILIADYGESAIGRVAPFDSGFWWIILLRAYTTSTRDALAKSPECQKGMRRILKLCLSEGLGIYPTLLCDDGCCMIDRRMDVSGYPIEIQALFYMALRCALSLLLKHDDEGKELEQLIVKRLYALRSHMRSYFWLDRKRLNDIYRYKTEEYSTRAENKFNIISDSIPGWILDFMPKSGGYFIGNVGPSRMDFRWFCLGNCISILSCLATKEQASAIMELFDQRWNQLVEEMPLKICYPAVEGHQWRMITGCDPKNTSWSYHNGGSWPVLLWLFTAACIKTGRLDLARRAIELAEPSLSNDGWPEYYDGKQGQFIGKQARKYQTWSIAGYLVAKKMLANKNFVDIIALEEETDIRPERRRSSSR